MQKVHVLHSVSQLQSHDLFEKTMQTNFTPACLNPTGCQSGMNKLLSGSTHRPKANKWHQNLPNLTSFLVHDVKEQAKLISVVKLNVESSSRIFLKQQVPSQNTLLAQEQAGSNLK